MSSNPLKIYKVIFIGHFGVGKSSIITNIIFGSKKCNDNIYPTIGAHYYAYKINNNIQIDFWDTAGQERYNSLLQLYYRSATLCILVFDLTNIDTLNRIENMIKEIDYLNNDTSYIIVGNKKDLLSDLEVKNINDKVRAKFSNYSNILGYIQTSAKKYENIQELMNIITEYLIKLSKNKKYNITINKKDSVIIDILDNTNITKEEKQNKNWLSSIYSKC